MPLAKVPSRKKPNRIIARNFPATLGSLLARRFGPHKYAAVGARGGAELDKKISPAIQSIRKPLSLMLTHDLVAHHTSPQNVVSILKEGLLSYNLSRKIGKMIDVRWVCRSDPNAIYAWSPKSSKRIAAQAFLPERTPSDVEIISRAKAREGESTIILRVPEYEVSQHKTVYDMERKIPKKAGIRRIVAIVNPPAEAVELAAQKGIPCYGTDGRLILPKPVHKGK